MDTTILEKQLADLNAKIAALKAEAAQTGREYFHGVVKEFFDATPEIRAFAWTQYTPHWNDGEACVFGVHDVEFTATDDEESDPFDYEFGDKGIAFERPSGWTYQYATDPDNGYRDDYLAEIARYDAAVAKHGQQRVDAINTRMESLKHVFGHVENDLMEMMFGDHVIVVATRDGFDVEEWDHD